MSDDAWRLTLPCTRAEAEAIADADIARAVLVTSEEDEARARWRLDAYFEGEPDAATLAAVRALVADAGAGQPHAVPAQDWVTLSQTGLEPIREGRFVVHTPMHAAAAPRGGRAFVIAAGQAFGTGHHATTAGCLAMLDRLALGGARFAHVVDLGTGTGLLAFAALELWPDAEVLATDVDPIAIAVTRENMAANRIERIELAVADGARALPVASDTRFDLVVANILAGPLIAMAPEINAVAAPEAVIVLAGLLSTQAEVVLAAYAACGCAEVTRDTRGDWTILLLRAGATQMRSDAPPGDRDGWATDD